MAIHCRAAKNSLRGTVYVYTLKAAWTYSGIVCRLRLTIYLLYTSKSRLSRTFSGLVLINMCHNASSQRTENEMITLISRATTAIATKKVYLIKNYDVVSIPLHLIEIEAAIDSSFSPLFPLYPLLFYPIPPSSPFSCLPSPLSFEHVITVVQVYLVLSRIAAPPPPSHFKQVYSFCVHKAIRH